MRRGAGSRPDGRCPCDASKGKPVAPELLRSEVAPLTFPRFSRAAQKPLKPLRALITNTVMQYNDPEMSAINTSDVKEWFKHKDTYSFLLQISPNSTNVSDSTISLS